MPEVFFNGSTGRIEGRYTESNDKKAPLALVLHPHPLHGGTMNNKVVYAAYKTLVNQGFTVLRINFPGVGRSQGSFDNGIAEMAAAATALDWLQVNNPYGGINLIAGFSFGSWIAMQLIMRRPEINYFMAISPPVDSWDFSFLSPCPIPGVIIHGDRDSIVSEDSVLELAGKLSKQKHIKVPYKLINGADHFFRNKIDELTLAMDEFLTDTFSNTASQEDDDDDIEDAILETTRQKVFLD